MSVDLEPTTYPPVDAQVRTDIYNRSVYSAMKRIKTL